MKKTLTATTLAIVLMFGATFANAGIIVGDRATNDTCKDGIIVGDRAGIIVGDSPVINGIITAITGIIIGGKADPAPCTSVSRNGIIIGG